MSDTEPMWILDFRPSVPTRYTRPAPLRFVKHLLAAAYACFWPLAVGAGLIVGYTVLTWLQEIAPTTAVH